MDSDKIIKVNYSISVETKNTVDRYRKKHKVNMSSAMDKILKFNKEGIAEYVRLISKFQEQQEWRLSTNEFMCTTIWHDIKIINTILGDGVDKNIVLEAAHKSLMDQLNDFNQDNDKIEDNNKIEMKAADVAKMQDDYNTLAVLYHKLMTQQKAINIKIDELEKKINSK
jgi:broad-specificity NMP kinase